MSKLVLARLGETEPDRIGLFASSIEASLSRKGRYEARMGGLALAARGVTFQAAYGEERRQAVETFMGIDQARDRSAQPLQLARIPYLNRRNYGILNDTNAAELRARLGAERLRHIQNAWDEPIEGGESLKDVHFRVRAFHLALVLPKLLEAPHNDVLVIADRDPLLAYRIELDLGYQEENGPVPESAIAAVELGIGAMRTYSFSPEGTISTAVTETPAAL